MKGDGFDVSRTPSPCDTENLNAARMLYRAFAHQDSEAIMAMITPDFHGVVAAGMPVGLAGDYHGAEEMLRRCWTRVFALVDLHPSPDEYLSCIDGRLVVTGAYRGTVRANGNPLNAAFAHVLRFRDGRIRQIIQITDTARWRQALQSD